MSDESIHNELNSIEAFAEYSKASLDVLIARCQKLRGKLQPVSTGRSKNKGLTAEQSAKLISDRRAKIYKKSR